MPPRLSPTFLAAVVVAFALLIGNAWLATRHREQATERVVTVREQIRVTDTLYRRDTITRREKITAWRTARDTTHDTTTVVRTLIAACDSALAADSVALRTGERRDSLHRVLEREIVKAAAPKPMQLYGEGLVRGGWQEPVYRVGATLRVVGRVALVAEAEHRGDDHHTTGRLGVRVTF